MEEGIVDLRYPRFIFKTEKSGFGLILSNFKSLFYASLEDWKLAESNGAEDEVILEMVDSMKLKFDKYWEDYSDILTIADVFDSRLKFTFLEHYFKP